MRKVLFIKIGAIGDVIMAMAAVNEFLKKFSDVELTWICGREVAPLIRTYFKKIKLIEIDERKLLKGNKLQQLLVILMTNLKVLATYWDAVITAYRDPRYRLLSISTFSSVRRSIDASKGEYFFRPGVYHGDAYYGLLSGAMPTDLKVHPGDLGAPRLLDSSSRAIAIAPGGAKNFMRDDGLRRYPIESYRILCSKLVENGFDVFVVGGRVDEWVREPLSMKGVRFELGTWRLEEVPDQLRGFNTLVTHDSGLMHMGILAGIRVISLFGPTRGDEKVPRNFDRNGSRFIQGGTSLACAPCYDGQNYADCASNECMKLIDPIYGILSAIQ